MQLLLFSAIRRNFNARTEISSAQVRAPYFWLNRFRVEATKHKNISCWEYCQQENLNSSQLSEIDGGEGARTPDLRLAKPALCQTELHPHSQISNRTFEIPIVGLSRFELLTSRLSGVRSNQLSYRPWIYICRKIKPLGLVSQVALRVQLTITVASVGNSERLWPPKELISNIDSP